MKDRFLFHLWTPKAVFSLVASPLVKILLLMLIRWKKNRSYTEKVKYPLCIQLIGSSTIFFLFYAEESLYSADRKFYHIFHVFCRGIFVFSWSEVLPYFSCFMQRNLCIKLIGSSTIFFMFYAEESLYSADRKFYHIFHVLCRGIFVFSWSKFYHIFHVLCRGIFVFSWSKVLPYFSCFMQRNLCIQLIRSSTIFFMFYAEESLYSADWKFYHIFHVLCRGIFVFIWSEVLPYFSCFMQRNLRIHLIESSTIFFHVLCRGIFVFSWSEVLPYFSCFMQRNLCIQLIESSTIFFHVLCRGIFVFSWSEVLPYFSCFMQRNLCIHLIESSTIFFHVLCRGIFVFSWSKVLPYFSCFMQRNLCIQLIESSTLFFMFYAEESLYSADQKFYHIFLVLCRGIFVFSWSKVLPYFSCFMQRNLFLLCYSMNYRDFSVKSKLIISLFQTVKLSL